MVSAKRDFCLSIIKNVNEHYMSWNKFEFMDHYNQNIKMRAIKYIFKVILKCKKLLKVKKIEPKILLNQSKFQFSTYTNFNME